MLCFGLISSICTHTAYADIYEYIDESGVAHYSDVPNNDDNHNYVLILKSEVPVAEVTGAEIIADSITA